MANQGDSPSTGPLITPVSVVVIAHDEDHNIVRCLTSVAWAAERIVVDSGSSDRTRERARELGATVYRHPWAGYGPQKNYGIERASQPWILSIDADEEVTPALAAEILQVLMSESPRVAFRVHVPTFLLGRPLGHYGRAAKDPGHIRLFRKDIGRFDGRRVHETVQIAGPVGWLHAPVLHHCYPSLRTYWRKIHRYAHLEARERWAGGESGGNRWLRAAGKLGWMLVVRRGMLDGPHAWLWIVGQAYQEWLTATEARRLLDCAPTRNAIA
jgi:glycosyltransferase involved in cell wall biosynthesis